MLYAWLEYYASPSWSPSRGNYMGSCYTPYNMQARSLTCDPSSCNGHSSHRAKTWKHAVPPISAALQTVSNLSWVGITELYDESMCLFECRLVGKLPRGCACDKSQKWQPPVPKKQLHRSGGGKYELSVGDALHRAMVDNLTRVDVQIHREGFIRLVRELRIAEKETGAHLLCPHRLATVRALTDYVPELWSSEDLAFTQSQRSSSLCRSSSRGVRRSSRRPHTSWS